MKCEICSGNIPQGGVWKFNDKDVCDDCYGEINGESSVTAERLMLAFCIVLFVLFLWWVV